MAASLCRRAPPLGPLPNEDIDVTDLEALEKYGSYPRYVRNAQEASKKTHWWRTYKEYMDAENPEKGEPFTFIIIFIFIVLMSVQ